MRKLVKTVVPLATIISLVGCGANAEDGVSAIIEDEKIEGEISIMAYDSMSYKAYLEAAVAAFEEKYPDTKVTIDTFSSMPEARTIDLGDGKKGQMITMEKDETAEMDYINKMSTQLMSGGGADILAIDILPYYKYAENGLLEDLSNYINIDTDFDVDDYSQNILEATKYKGGQYILPMDYNFEILTYDSSYMNDDQEQYFEDNNTLNYRDLIEVGSEVLEDNDIKLFGLFGGIEAMPNLFTTLGGLNFSKFVDLETGKVDFTSGSFEQLLEDVKSYEEQGFLMEGMIERDSTGEPGGRIMMQGNRETTLFDISNSMILPRLFYREENRDIMISGSGAIDENTEIGGILTNDDNQVNFEFSQAYGINSNSQNKKLAWEFLKFLASEEQQKSLELRGYPINNDALEEKLKENILGNMFRRLMDEEETTNNDPVELTEEQQIAYEKLKEAVDKYSKELNNYVITDEVITSMIMSEVREFFNGSKSATEVSNALQSKVELYVNEGK